MEKSAVPAVLKIGARSRSPVVPTGYDELFGDAIKNRIQTRIGELDRDIGRVTLEQPNPPLEPLPRGGNTMLPPSDDAVGGVVPVVRSGFIAKYDPDHPGRGTDFDSTDPFWEYDWINPAGAIDGPWLVPRHRGLRKIIDGGSLHPGDLVFLLRTKGLPGERESHPSLARRTLVGVCWAELVGSYFPEVDGPGATLFPIRRFNFPVPVDATRDADADFASVNAFSDRSRSGVIELTLDELLAVTRDCGLPLDILTEPDPDRLAPIAQGLDLGPPVAVRRRILEGARAQDHRDQVARRAVNHVVKATRTCRFGVADTQGERGAQGAGADIWLNAIGPGGKPETVRVEVKGLSGSNPGQARLTRNELAAAERATRGGDPWWLAIVTNALQTAPDTYWLSEAEALTVFTVPDSAGAVFSADRRALGALLAGA